MLMPLKNAGTPLPAVFSIRGKSVRLLPVSAVGDNFLCFFRINFPIAVALLPLEAMLSLSLYGVLNQNANNSPDSNKQRKGPELLGKVSMPLFDFRRQVIK